MRVFFVNGSVELMKIIAFHLCITWDPGNLHLITFSLAPFAKDACQVFNNLFF